MLVQLLYIVTLLSSVAGAFAVVLAVSSSTPGPMAALGAAVAVVPYVFTRSVQIVVDRQQAKTRHEDLVRTLEILSDRLDRRQRDTRPLG